MSENKTVPNQDGTTYEVKEPLPVCPVNGYKTVAEFIEAVKEYGIRNNFVTVVKRNEFNKSHKRVHIGCIYSGKAATRLNSTFKIGCPYLVKATFIR